ncbi:MAG: hypothetical protein HGB32_16385 [Geobacteraceae bacterium]|nr:hypothetical protein [Geobacteraceae bacterium]NTW81698.1 hypothetical protein [Geobacteraceae bacterium]
MKTRIITTLAVAGLLAALAAGDVFAAGRGNGGGSAQRNEIRTAAQTATAASVRSQRRDGTFLTTGTTANGSTTRQGKGNGLMDGSHLTATPAATAVTTTTP